MGSDLAVILYGVGGRSLTWLRSKFQNDRHSAFNTTLKIKHRVPNSNIIADEGRSRGGIVDNVNIKVWINNSKALKAEKYQNKTQYI